VPAGFNRLNFWARNLHIWHNAPDGGACIVRLAVLRYPGGATPAQALLDTPPYAWWNRGDFFYNDWSYLRAPAPFVIAPGDLIRLVVIMKAGNIRWDIPDPGLFMSVSYSIQFTTQ
jgi:hypothetical protein